MRYTDSKMASAKLAISVSIVLLFLVLESETKTKMDYDQRFMLAREHYKRVLPQISCRFPKPKIFKVDSPSMALVPSATVLHRCGEQAGCCSLPTYKCVPKTKEKVRLYFLVKTFPGAVRRRRKRVKKLVMTNHTECHCLDMSYRPR